MNTTPETPSTLEQFAQFAREFANSPSKITPMTWGYEIESNTMANVHAQAVETADQQTINIVSWQSDASVSDESDYAGNEDCDCECSECYHSCDCDACDYNSGDRSLDHDCGSSDCYGGASDYQEVASIGGITYSHPETLNRLADWGINDATFNSDTGIHIHIGSDSFSAPQIANIMTAYRLAKPVLDQIAERAGTHYARAHTPETENDARSANASGGKYQEVNVANHFNTYGHVQTIEFRQMAGTSNSGLNQTDRVRAWAEVLRMLVQYATRQAPSLYWLGRAKDLNDLIRLLKA